MPAHQFTGVWQEWQYQYDPEDSHSRSAFLTAILDRALKRKEAEAARSVMDVESGQHDMAAAEGQGVQVT